MNTILLATLTGLAALVLWGSSDWLASKSSKKFTSREVNVAMQVIGMIIMGIVWGIARTPLHHASDVFTLAAASIFFTFAYLCFIRALATGEVGVVVPIGNIYPLITLILTFLFIAVSFTHLQILAMVIIVLGSVLLGVEKINWHKPHKNFSQAALLALAAAVLWGVGFFIVNFEVKKLAWQSIEFVTSESMGIYALLIAIVANRKEIVSTVKKAAINKTGIIAGALLTSGAIAFYIGATRAKNLLVPAVLASGAPLFTSILAWIFDRERTILLKRVGAVLVVGGVLLLNFK